MESLVRAKPIEHLLKMQMVVMLVTGILISVFYDIDKLSPYLYGGFIGLLNTAIQRWHLYAAAKHAKADASKNLGRAYRCVAERWVLTITLFAIGYVVFELDKMVLIGFAVTQVIVLIGNYRRA
jgi:ATP synthase protein I